MTVEGTENSDIVSLHDQTTHQQLQHVIRDDTYAPLSAILQKTAFL
jgi:hypothetical protein